jgi:hypothetical protein
MNRIIPAFLIAASALQGLSLAQSAPAAGEDPAFIAKSARAIDTHVAAWYLSLIHI